MSGATDTLKPLARLLQLALRLGTGQEVTSGYIRQVYRVSQATAKRDLVRLECALPVTIEERRHAHGDRHLQKVLRLNPGATFIPLLRVSAS